MVEGVAKWWIDGPEGADFDRRRERKKRIIFKQIRKKWIETRSSGEQGGKIAAKGGDVFV